MKVLIVSTNRCAEPVPVMPLGACMVAEAAQRDGHDVRVLDLMFARRPGRALASELAAFVPGAVAVSVRNIDNGRMAAPQSYCGDLASLVGTVRSATAAPVIIGGGAVSVMTESLLRLTCADWAVPGEGEATFPRLLAALAAGDDPRAVPGVAWLADDALQVAPGREPCDLSGPVSPDFARWTDVRAYLRRFAAVPVQTKRGCPFECNYCTYRILEGGTYRLRRPEAVADAVRGLATQGWREIDFVDNVFNSPYDHAMAVCNALADMGAPARLQTVDMNPAFVDDRLLAAMDRAGFVGIGIAAESAVDPVLQGLGKNYGAEQVRQAADAVGRSGLPCLWAFLLGGPGETEETARETLRFAADILRPCDAAFLSVGIRIYPGTALEGIAREQGMATRPTDDPLDPAFYVAPDLGADRLIELAREALAAEPGFLALDLAPMPMLPVMQRLARRLGFRPPIWRHTRLVRRALGVLGLGGARWRQKTVGQE